jgi:hypothetical protein
MAYPSPLLDEKVLSETVALETIGPQMDPSAAPPVPSAAKMLLLIFKPLAPAAPTETPIVALPVVSSLFQDISTSCGALVSWTKKVVPAPLLIVKPLPAVPPSTKLSAPLSRSTTTPLSAVRVVRPRPRTLLSVMSDLLT